MRADIVHVLKSSQSLFIKRLIGCDPVALARWVFPKTLWNHFQTYYSISPSSTIPLLIAFPPIKPPPFLPNPIPPIDGPSSAITSAEYLPVVTLSYRALRVLLTGSRVSHSDPGTSLTVETLAGAWGTGLVRTWVITMVVHCWRYVSGNAGPWLADKW